MQTYEKYLIVVLFDFSCREYFNMDGKNGAKSNWTHVDADANEKEKKAPMSLRYLNEFVGKLQCASQLLQLQIFPDAKEVTEVYWNIFM